MKYVTDLAVVRQETRELVTHSGFLTISLRMKSLPWSETPLKLSASKSQSHLATFCIVSALSSPANGDRPLNLQQVMREETLWVGMYDYLHVQYACILCVGTTIN